MASENDDEDSLRKNLGDTSNSERKDINDLRSGKKIYKSPKCQQVEKTAILPLLDTVKGDKSQVTCMGSCLRQESALVSIVLSDPSIEPVYADEGASGADLYAYIEEDIVISPMKRACIATGVRVAIPNGCEIQVRPRSGLAFKNGITVLNTPGTIDSSYRGEIKVILINLGDKDFTVKPRMRIAQAVCTPIKKMHFYVKTEKEFDESYSTSRGSGGFGSTGV